MTDDTYDAEDGYEDSVSYDYPAFLAQQGYPFPDQDGEPVEVALKLEGVPPEQLAALLGTFLESLARAMRDAVGLTRDQSEGVTRARWWAVYPDAVEVAALLYDAFKQENSRSEIMIPDLLAEERLARGRDVLNVLLEVAWQSAFPADTQHQSRETYDGPLWVLGILPQGRRDPFDVALEHAAARIGVVLEPVPIAQSVPDETIAGVTMPSAASWIWWEANRERALAAYLIERLDRADGPLPYDKWLQPLELARSRPLVTALQEGGLIRVDEEGRVWRTHPER